MREVARIRTTESALVDRRYSTLDLHPTVTVSPCLGMLAFHVSGCGGDGSGDDAHAHDEHDGGGACDGESGGAHRNHGGRSAGLSSHTRAHRARSWTAAGTTSLS